MKTMGAAAFKAHCLAVLDEVQEHGEEVIITKRGKPVAKLVPLEAKKPEGIFGWAKGQFEIVGDIVEPAMTDEEVVQWERGWDGLNK